MESSPFTCKLQLNHLISRDNQLSLSGTISPPHTSLHDSKVISLQHDLQPLPLPEKRPCITAMSYRETNLMNRKRERNLLVISSLMDFVCPSVWGRRNSLVSFPLIHTPALCGWLERLDYPHFTNVEISAHRGAKDHLIGTGNHFLPRRFSPPPKRPHPSFWISQQLASLYTISEDFQDLKLDCNFHPTYSY